MAKIKRSFPLFGTELWIKVKRGYSAEELLELMRQNFGDKYGLLEVKGILLLKHVAVNGVQGYKITVMPAGNAMFGHSIVIRQEKKLEAPPHTLGGCVFGFISGIFHILTLGIAHWEIWGFRKNWHIMKPLSEDIVKIVEG